VMRMILDAYFDGTFSDHSHGFRSERGCHTALREIYRTWTGTAWIIEGDIADCFGSLDHDLIISALAEHIQDGRFLNLVKKLLEAGYMDNWTFNQTFSGVPQGSILSPVLSNILLSKLDRFVETELMPQYNTGRKKRANQVYQNLIHRAHQRRKNGQMEAAQKLKHQAQQLPAIDPQDPDYRRLRYCRYADDVRHLTHYSIPLGERRSSEEMTSGSLGLPGGESQRGNEHAEKAEKGVKTLCALFRKTRLIW